MGPECGRAKEGMAAVVGWKLLFGGYVVTILDYHHHQFLCKCPTRRWRAPCFFREFPGTTSTVFTIITTTTPTHPHVSKPIRKHTSRRRASYFYTNRVAFIASFSCYLYILFLLLVNAGIISLPVFSTVLGLFSKGEYQVTSENLNVYDIWNFPSVPLLGQHIKIFLFVFTPCLFFALRQQV